MAVDGGVWLVSVDSHSADEAGQHRARMRFVTPGFFRTLGIPISRAGWERVRYQEYRAVLVDPMTVIRTE